LLLSVSVKRRVCNAITASLEGDMTSRKLGLGLVVLAASVFSLAGTASAHGTSSAGAGAAGTCVVHSLPSFIAQGEFGATATVADVIEVECDPTVYGTGSTIKITASQLFDRCKGRLIWVVPNPFTKTTTARGINVKVDADGNATVVAIAGPECMAGESLVTAHMVEEPFESFTTSFTVLPPVPTPPGVYALAATPGAPNTQVEDAGSSAVAAIIEAEFANGSEKLIRIGSEELFARCRVAPKLRWIFVAPTGTTGFKIEEVTAEPEVNKNKLDNDGNAFVVVVGDSSCAPGPSLI